MLQDLENLLKLNGLFFEEELGKIAHSCCPSETKKVINFDKIKDVYFQLIGVRKLKSVDVIYLAKTRNELFLIEMKGYNAGGALNCEQFIDTHYAKYAIGNKIADTIFTILGIIGYYRINPTFYEFIFNPDKLKIKTFLLTNFSYSDLTSLSLATLDKQKIGLTKRIEGETIILNCDSFTRLMSMA